MQKLYTEEGRNLSEAAWTAYPRPQMRREDWLCLNGTWNLTVLHREEIRKEQIRVPFCAESLLAGLEGILYEKQQTIFGVWIVHWVFGVSGTLLCLIDH